jgi:hypothetical protein
MEGVQLIAPTTDEDGDIELADVHFACPPYASIRLNGWEIRDGVVFYEGRCEIYRWSDEKRLQHDRQVQRSQSCLAPLLRRVPIRRIRRRFVDPGAPWRVILTNNAVMSGEQALYFPGY